MLRERFGEYKFKMEDHNIPLTISDQATLKYTDSSDFLYKWADGRNLLTHPLVVTRLKELNTKVSS